MSVHNEIRSQTSSKYGDKVRFILGVISPDSLYACVEANVVSEMTTVNLHVSISVLDEAIVW